MAVLSEPADTSWLLARVMSLMLPYYEKQTPQAVREMEAEDWAEALGDYPQWAIDAAVRWWKSDKNPNKNRRPVEGDITARLKVDMRPISNAQWKIEEFDNPRPKYGPIDAPERKPCTPEAAAEIMARAGFAPKRFGGSE